MPTGHGRIASGSRRADFFVDRTNAPAVGHAASELVTSVVATDFTGIELRRADRFVDVWEGAAVDRSADARIVPAEGCVFEVRSVTTFRTLASLRYAELTANVDVNCVGGFGSAEGLRLIILITLAAVATSAAAIIATHGRCQNRRRN